MALINCNECGHMISEYARKCPNCGCPIEKVDAIQEVIEVEEPKKNKTWIWVLIVTLLCLLGGGGYYAYTKMSKDNTTEKVVEKPKKEVVEEKEVEVKEDVVEITPEFIQAIKKYSVIGVFSDGMAAVRGKNDKWGYINTKGEEVISTMIDAMFVGRFSEGLAFVCPDVMDLDRGAECYVIDKTGKKVFDVKNFYLDACGEGMDSEDMPYFIDGKLYTIISESSDSKCNFKYEVYDKQGKRIGTVGHEEGEAYYKKHEVSDYAIISKTRDGLDDNDGDGQDVVYGVKDLSGKRVLATEYDKINLSTNFANGVVLVTLTEFDEDQDGEAGRVVYYYGYADMKGNDTFSSVLKRKYKQSKIEAKKKFGNQDESSNNCDNNYYGSEDNE